MSYINFYKNGKIGFYFKLCGKDKIQDKSMTELKENLITKTELKKLLPFEKIFREQI